MKLPSDFKRIRRAQARAAKRLRQFRVREEFMRRVAARLQQQEQDHDRIVQDQT